MSRAAGAFAAAAFIAGCSLFQPAPLPAWSAHLAQFEKAYFDAVPPAGVSAGRHEYDGQLPDWSRAGLEAWVEVLKATRERTQRYEDHALTPAERFEKQYLLARLDGELFWEEQAQAPFTNPVYYLGALEPSAYLARPYAAPEVRMKAFTAYLRAFPRAARQIRANLRTPMPRTFAERGASAFAGYASFFPGDGTKAFAAVADPALQAELKAAAATAAQAAQELAGWFEAERARANEDFALGKERFAAMLWATERVDTPLAELEAIGRADLARNQAALKQVCRGFAPNKTLLQCLQKVNRNKPRGGPVQGAREQLAELRQFLVDRKLVSIPGSERARVEEAPEYQRWNFAYIDIPGPYDKGMPAVYYIAPPDPAWPKAEQEAYLPGKADLLFTSVHEVWPGHFLQYLHANRAASRFGQVFVGYAFAEGWAHYAEELMWEAGLGDGDAETHIGQLSNALLRNARYLCAIGLHTQGMSVEECERVFREEAWQDPGNSRQQAARGTYDPAYLNYTMGKLMIRKLRADWTASRGGRKAWRAFHDALLGYGGPPLPLVREQMLGKQDGALFR
jgi:hypothetical protein